MWSQTRSIFPTRSIHPIQTILMISWVLTMIFMPIINWMYGWDFLINMVNLSVIVQVSAVIAVLWKAWGTTKTLRITALVFILGWTAEAIGSHTGYPFGSYVYTNALQPQFFHVPLLIPLAWMMMLPPAWGVGQAISRRFNPRWQLIGFVGFSALAMTAWDLFLDPQMVSWGFWEWHTPGGYFGVPWSNYLGWLFVAGTITMIIRPQQLPVTLLLLIYSITWFLQTIGQGLFWDMPGSAIVGGIIMGIMTYLGWRTHLQDMK